MPGMFRLLGLVISIGLADSLNPTTIAPALYLATGDQARRRVIEFTLSVFVVYFVGGALIAIGPGALLRSLVPHIQATIRHAVEIAAGVGLLIAAAMLWRSRERLVARGLPASNPKGRSSALLGASITALELPTAFPYFAAIAAVLASGLGPPRQLFLLLVFNVCFIAPLLGIIATLTFAGPRSERLLAKGRSYLERRWPHTLAILFVIVGLFALVFGVTGLAAQGHGRLGRFFRHVRHILHLHP
jgi:cytochrome c biogenesis protein CcdA